MKVELPYYKIGQSYGSNQDWFRDPMMRIGGCAAVTVCDSCIYFAKYFGWHELYPYNSDEIRKADFISFSKILKPYLRPRMSGINTLKLYIDGTGQYFKDLGSKRPSMKPFSGHESLQDAKRVIREQIDEKYPIPCLILKHSNPKMQDYVWHWFLLTGYEERREMFRVKTVTYGAARWVELEELWNTGYEERGGLVLFQ